MLRRAVLVGGLLGGGLIASGPAAQAHQPGRACRQPNVVTVMARALDDRAAYSVLNPSEIMQIPTPDPAIVQCEFCLWITSYDTPKYGDRTLVHCETHRFRVKTVQNGFVVTPLS